MGNSLVLSPIYALYQRSTGEWVRIDNDPAELGAVWRKTRVGVPSDQCAEAESKADKCQRRVQSSVQYHEL
jgi:hypothetical protein